MKLEETNLAPVVLFVFNRADHTRRTLEALEQNYLSKDTILYVYSDGAKNNATQDEILAIEDTRSVLREKTWCKEIHIIESEINKGLALSVVDGVSEIINKHGKIIVLEDDIITEIGFLTYMNQMLNLYIDNQKVMHISAYMYPVQVEIKPSTFVLNILSCWGWATWKRAWDHYDPDVDNHLKKIGEKPENINKFNIEGHAHFYEQLLLNRDNKINTWAVKWYASWLFSEGVSIFPNKSLVQNIGHDGTGENCGENSIFKVETKKELLVDNIVLLEETSLRKEVDLFFENNFSIIPKKYPDSFLKKVKTKLKLRIKSFVYKVFPELNRLKLLSRLDDNINFLSNSSNQCHISLKSKIYPPFKLNNSSIGDYSYVAPNSIINRTEIGKFCSIGPNLISGWGKHPIDGISTSPMFYSTEKQNGFTLTNENKVEEVSSIFIGNDVFIGMNVTILDGVSIGHGAVIGAGAVVSKDIPAYAVAIGNPIRIIKYRFEESEIEKLLNTEWWNWEEEKLKKVESNFFDLNTFLNKTKV
ncbi:CatB-related O-acetyltransferase [Winogradskyella undariae]|uniref:CatB-related O-acetyltransferase n=1 Tax=Winogradskyella undariae TaxID=1285465 RepID=UPI00211C1072|nr:CatB-related O-acetyltransferase [Winogradskyella undariae]